MIPEENRMLIYENENYKYFIDKRTHQLNEQYIKTNPELYFDPLTIFKGKKLVYELDEVEYCDYIVTPTYTVEIIAERKIKENLIPLYNLKHEEPVDYIKLPEDNVNHPKHYTSHPSGVECIEITQHMNFNIGNAIKYLWRAGLKNQKTLKEDIKKAIWYMNRELERIDKLENKGEK